jgi:ABC-type multidrug transport system permease subunit
MCLTVYWMTNLRHGIRHFTIFYLVAYLTLVCNLYLGRFVSTLTPNTMVNVLIFPPLTMTIQAMLCGYACMISTLPDWFQWLTSVDVAKWCMGIQFINQLQGTDELIADYHSLLNDFGWNYPMRDQFANIVYILMVNMTLTYLGMRYFTSSSS